MDKKSVAESTSSQERFEIPRFNYYKIVIASLFSFFILLSVWEKKKDMSRTCYRS